MAKFNCYIRTEDSASSKRRFATADTMEKAISACKEKVKEIGNDNEVETAAKALELRGFYCVGWSANEIFIEEE